MDNPYVDALGVFKNKLGIADANELSVAEYALTSVRSDEILGGRVDLGVMGYGLARQAAIHAHLFQDVYEWAGKIRVSALSKRAVNGWVSRFEQADAIESSWQMLEGVINQLITQNAVSFAQKSHRLADIFVQANRIHAFAEGNGRSLQVFMKQLAKHVNVELDYTQINAIEWNHASAVSAEHGRLFEGMHFIPLPPDHEPIRKIFARMARSRLVNS